MSERYDVDDAQCDLRLTSPATDRHALGLDGPDVEDWALVIGDPFAGAHAIAGTPAELRGFALRVLELAEQLPAT